MNGRDIQILPENRHINSYLDPESINYYETLINRNGFQVIEINSCYGDINLAVSQNYSAFLEEKYDDDLNIEESTQS